MAALVIFAGVAIARHKEKKRLKKASADERYRELQAETQQRLARYDSRQTTIPSTESGVDDEEADVETEQQGENLVDDGDWWEDGSSSPLQSQQQRRRPDPLSSPLSPSPPSYEDSGGQRSATALSQTESRCALNPWRPPTGERSDTGWSGMTASTARAG